MTIRSDIKKAQREKFLLREVSQLLLEASKDDPRLQKAQISRIQLSPDKSHCTIYFYMPEGEKVFQEILEVLKLYRPSLRSALAKSMSTKYIPELIFSYDTLYEKQERIHLLLDELKQKGQA